jgi:hypothetical protein
VDARVSTRGAEAAGPAGGEVSEPVKEKQA